MTYIFIIATAVSVGIWSLLIIKIQQISRCLGYFRTAILLIGLIGVCFQFDFTDLFGFRTFVFFLVGWKIAIGFALIKVRKERIEI